MRQRDKDILRDLTRFRCMTGRDIAALHFSHTKNPIKEASLVILRLRDRGYIDANTKTRREYVYFPAESKMKRDSSKIDHYLAIVSFYRELLEYGDVPIFDVEPTITGKGGPEPDAFFRFKRGYFYLELQRSIYSERVMAEKMKRYQAFYESGEWKTAAWQRPERPVFPSVWMITERTYNLPKTSFHVFQTRTAAELIKKFT